MRNIVKIVICALLCISMFSCANEASVNSSIVALEVGGVADSTDGGNHKAEYVPSVTENFGRFKDENAPREFTVTFENVTYTGEYNHSERDMFVNYQKDYYHTDGIFFSVNSETKKLTSISFRDTENGNLTESDCREIADDFVSDYLNLKECIVESNVYSKWYNFFYISSIGDFWTNEVVSISISTDGQICYFEAQMIGEFEKTGISRSNLEARVKALHSDEAMKVLESKIQSIYSDYISYEIGDSYVVILEDGSVGISYGVSVTYKSEYSTDEFIETSSATSIILK